MLRTCDPQQNRYAQKVQNVMKIAILRRLNAITGKRMAIAKKSLVFIKDKKIRLLMSEFNMTYRKALTVYVPSRTPSPTRNDK